MGIKVIVGVVVVAAVGVGVGWQYLGGDTATRAPVAAPTAAECLEDDWDPTSVFMFVMGAKTRAEALQNLASIQGVWTPMRGWEGEVEAVSKEPGGTAIRMFYSAAGRVGGGFWVVAVVPGELPDKIHRRDVVTYQGRIRTVENRLDGPNINDRVILDDARILGIRGR